MKDFAILMERTDELAEQLIVAIGYLGTGLKHFLDGDARLDLLEC